jgi:hypothetical protein
VCELEPMVLSRLAACGWCDDDTSTPRGTDDEDDPDMSLQSIVALVMSPLQDGSGDGSSLEETPDFPTFRRLIWLLLRSRLVIWRFLCCALREAHLSSAATFFWLKIASSGEAPWPGQGGCSSTATTRMLRV